MTTSLSTVPDHVKRLRSWACAAVAASGSIEREAKREARVRLNVRMGSSSRNAWVKSRVSASRDRRVGASSECALCPPYSNALTVPELWHSSSLPEPRLQVPVIQAHTNSEYKSVYESTKRERIELS